MDGRTAKFGLGDRSTPLSSVVMRVLTTMRVVRASVEKSAEDLIRNIRMSGETLALEAGIESRHKEGPG